VGAGEDRSSIPWLATCLLLEAGLMFSLPRPTEVDKFEVYAARISLGKEDGSEVLHHHDAQTHFPQVHVNGKAKSATVVL